MSEHKRSKYKLVIVMRTDLEMTKGKMCVQASHATLLAWIRKEQALPQSDIETMHEWLSEGQFKIVVKVKNLVELNNIAASARQANLPVAVVEDYGFTEVEPDTVTCIAIGPALASEVDAITKNLPLL